MSTQPSLPLYPFSPALNLFPVADASTPGAFDDPSQPRQNWADPAAASLPPSQIMNYFYWDQNTGKQVFFTRTAAQAAVPNIDLGPYPAYAPPALVNVVASFPAFPLLKPINLTDPTIFSTPAQAAALATSLNATVIDITPNTEVITYPSGEDRREFGLVLPNRTIVNAGKLLVIQYAQGVGAPGKWSLDASGNPLWTPTVAPVVALPPIPTPQRALLPNETIQSVSVAGFSYFEISRTDLNSTPGTSSAPSAMDQDTNATVHQILTALQKLGIVS